MAWQKSQWHSRAPRATPTLKKGAKRTLDVQREVNAKKEESFESERWTHAMKAETLTRRCSQAVQAKLA
jgi:hypothetical protein